MSRVIPAMGLALLLLVSSPLYAENPEEESTIGRKLEGIEKASTFVQLLKNTDKAEALLFAPSGTTTVFVPTNEAFERMDSMRRERLFDPQNKHWLERVLTYHALHNSRIDGYVVGRVDFLKNGLGQYLTVQTGSDGSTRIDGANVSQTDLVCSNGIVHFIDEVLDPVELDLFEQLEQDGRFTILTKLITRSGLTKLFQNRHQVYTVFAPTDEAFASLPEGTIDALMGPEKLDLLSDIIRSHIVEGARTLGKIDGVQPLGTPGTTTLNQYEQFLIFRKDGTQASVDGRAIVESDRVARNGFLHVIDRPLMPKRQSLADKLHEAGEYETFLQLCKRAGVYDLLGQFNEKITVFAPVDSVFESDESRAQLKALMRSENTELLRGILQRHFVRGSTILTTNSISFRRFNSTLNGRLDFSRNGDERTIQGVPIENTDLLARNGVAHGIRGLIPFNMEEVDQDQNWTRYREYVRETLRQGSELYSQGQLQEATNYYARRNYEFVTRYGTEIERLYQIQPGRVLNNDRSRNFRYDFAITAWRQRNGFRELLRAIETKKPLLIDEQTLLEQGMNVIVIGNNATLRPRESTAASSDAASDSLAK